MEENVKKKEFFQNWLMVRIISTKQTTSDNKRIIHDYTHLLTESAVGLAVTLHHQTFIKQLKLYENGKNS